MLEAKVRNTSATIYDLYPSEIGDKNNRKIVDSAHKEERNGKMLWWRLQ